MGSGDCNIFMFLEEQSPYFAFVRWSALPTFKIPQISLRALGIIRGGPGRMFLSFVSFLLTGKKPSTPRVLSTKAHIAFFHCSPFTKANAPFAVVGSGHQAGTPATETITSLQPGGAPAACDRRCMSAEKIGSTRAQSRCKEAVSSSCHRHPLSVRCSLTLPSHSVYTP